MMKRKTFPSLAAAAVALVLLGGCSNDAGLDALDRAATAEDALPGFVTVAAPANPETARLVATHDGTRYFIVQSDDTRMACLVIIPPGENPDWQAGCGTNRGPGEIAALGKADESTGILLGDGSGTGRGKSGWIHLSDNVLIPAP